MPSLREGFERVIRHFVNQPISCFVSLPIMQKHLSIKLTNSFLINGCFLTLYKLGWGKFFLVCIEFQNVPL